MQILQIIIVIVNNYLYFARTLHNIKMKALTLDARKTEIALLDILRIPCSSRKSYVYFRLISSQPFLLQGLTHPGVEKRQTKNKSWCRTRLLTGLSLAYKTNLRSNFQNIINNCSKSRKTTNLTLRILFLLQLFAKFRDIC
jgi:hypothetical protein